MKTLIASLDQKESILRNLASKNNGILEGVQVLTLNTALKEEKDDSILLSLQLRNLLLQQINQFEIYGKMFSFPAFINEILSFTKECILYRIDPSDLPETNRNEAELKQIISIALTLDLSEKRNIQHTDIQDLQDISLHYQFIKDMYHYNIYESLKQNIPYDAYPENHPSVLLHYALSARMEAEAIAQDIAQSGIPCNIVLTSQTQLPLYESVLQRYEIPYTSLKESKSLHIIKIFQSLIQLGIHHDQRSLLDALKYHAFPEEVEADVYTFFQETLIDTSFPSDLSGYENADIFQREIQQYNKIYEKAKAYYALIEEDLEKLIHSSGLELLYTAFDILRRSEYLKDKAELLGASSLRQTIIECSDQIRTNDDVLYLSRCFENIKASVQTSLSDFCTITDLTHPVEPKKKSYVVSCSGANYPGVPVNTGLFDENYVEKIKCYPSQDARYQMYMSQLSWVKNSASEQLIYSHYTNDYQGREIQLAFEIENQYPDIDSQWKIVSLKPYMEQEHHLDPDTAQALFETNGKITGSVSTIERYFACPYSYFIQSGLKVREKSIPSLDAASIGSIQHKVLEDNVKEKGKEYAQLSEEDIRAFITPAFDILAHLHPKETMLLKMSKERLIQSMMLSLSFLSDFERNTSFKPEEVEYRFSEDITDGVHLNGVIDRLDLYRNEMFRIIDYKSSAHVLSETKVKSGSQLQLLSYLIIACRKWKCKPAGAYYFSLKEEAYSVEAKKVSRSKVSETEWDIDSEAKRMLNARRLCGWKFEDRDTESDASGSHLKNARGVFSYDLVEKCIISLYDMFRQEVLQGNIALSPREDACDFCDYKCICRFHSIKRKAEKLVMAETPLNGKEK